LIVAVDQLSKKRRAAGQSYDDAKNAAWAELRAEFYNRSSLAMVISPSSGDAFVILPQPWARDEIALTWLEQGECLLHEDFVYPWRLPMAPSGHGSPESIPGHWPQMLRGERAPISMSEHDLQRLMAKQEVKQEAAPRLDGREPWPKSPPLSGEPLIESGAVEVLPEPQEPERVEAPEPAKPAEQELRGPADWQAWALKKYARRRRERQEVYIRRLHGLMEEADNVTEVWTYENFRRRYFELVKER
jgi:hypothetical protein